GNVDVSVRFFVRGDTATSALRGGGPPLHRRANKRHAGPATLPPPVAAALARLAAPAPGETALDPCCGDGTIAIELLRASPGTTVIGADLDPARVAHARANAGPEPVRLLVADAGR